MEYGAAILLAAVIAVGSCAPPQRTLPGPPTFEESAAAKLSAGEWTITEIDGRPVVAGAQAGRHLVLLFSPNGEVSGQACNRLGGQYRIEKQRLVIGPIAMTEMSCGEEMDRLEGRLLQIVSVPNEFQFTPDGTLLVGDPGQPALRLQRSREARAGNDAPGDRCNASKYRYLVGRHRTSIPPAPAGATWRVTCSSCAVDMSFSEGRLNIVYNDKTGVVTSVGCG